MHQRLTLPTAYFPRPAEYRVPITGYFLLLLSKSPRDPRTPSAHAAAPLVRRRRIRRGATGPPQADPPVLLAFDSHWQTSCQWHPCVPTHQPHGATRVPALLWPWVYDAVGSFGHCAFSPSWPRCSRTAETTIHSFILLHLPSPLFPIPCFPVPYSLLPSSLFPLPFFPSSSARTKSPRDAPTCVTCPALDGIVKGDRSARGVV